MVKSKFKVPHTLVLLFGLVLVTFLIGRVVPIGVRRRRHRSISIPS